MRNVLITGGAQGIGKALVERFLVLGDQVIFCDRNNSSATALLQTLNHPKLTYIQVDLSDYEDVKRMFKQIRDDYGALDILVNNAALQIESSFSEIDVQDWQAVIDTNLNGTFYCIKEAAKIMHAGSIVNISSLYSHKVRLNKFSYDASKAAIQRMSEEFALALAPSIRINTVEPGAIDTPMNQIFTQAEVREAVIKRIPLARIGTGNDIAKAVVFLCSDDADYITGSTLKVDGGRALL
ncbi:MAG TPA: 3-oxoacyl-ACP reductase [Erysipelotrichaceae bacterium]|nr:3-oxoacyl-ACP reductase [Erysipelotrichaceae bacterium]